MMATVTGRGEFVRKQWREWYGGVPPMGHLNDDDEPILYPKADFLVVDDRVPQDWQKDDFDEGDCYIDPPELAGKGFDEDFFAGDEVGRETFWTVYERIVKECGDLVVRQRLRQS